MMNDSLIKPLPVLPPAAAARPAVGSTKPPALQEGGKELPASIVSGAAKQNLSEVVASLNDHFQNVKRDLQFEVDNTSGRAVITVLDSENGEVIRKIPPESVMAMASYLRDEGSLPSFGFAEKV